MISTPFCLENRLRSKTYVTRHSSEDRKKANPIAWEKEIVITEEYDKSYYPPYCGGHCCLVSSSYLIKIKEISETTNPQGFPIEDVFFTGVLRTLAGMSTPIPLHNICTHFNKNDKIKKLSTAIKRYLGFTLCGR